MAIGASLAGDALGQVPPADVRRFEIPEQPLASALGRFATASGVDIAYGQSLATGRRSSPLYGEHTPAAGLEVLLRGTGLSARFTGPRAAIIHQPGATAAPVERHARGATAALTLDMAEVRAPVMVGSRDRSHHQRYALAVQGELNELLRTESRHERNAFRLEIRITIDAGGVIREAAVRRTSGETARDRSIIDALLGHPLSSPPPSDLVDPLVFEIISDPVIANQPPRRRPR